MKKIIFGISIAFVLVFFTAASSVAKIEEPVKEEPTYSYFKLKNDTDNKIRIHTGSGVVTLYKGGTTSISCKPGRKIYTAPNGTKKDFIFEVKSSMCGKTVMLSEYL